MQKLPATLIAALLTIAVHGVAYPADSDDSPYVTQQNHAAPVTITESPDYPTEQSTAEQYAERRQNMIEECERNKGIDCAGEVDIELGAEALHLDHVVHRMRRMGGTR